MAMEECSVQDATHVVTRGGSVERITGSYGIDESGALAPPSRGGFGVTTESGRTVGMFNALRYYREVPDKKK